MFSCEFYEISKATFFTERHWATAFEQIFPMVFILLDIHIFVIFTKKDVQGGRLKVKIIVFFQWEWQRF